jgi:undecaprenyl-diphosphatase
MPALDLRKHLHDRWVLLVLAAVGLGAAYLFSRFGSQVHQGGLSELDQAVRTFVFEHRPRFVVAILEAVTRLGATQVLAPAGAVAAWLLFRSAILAGLVLVCGGVSSEFVDLLKAGFGVIRPATGLAERESLSFPSGHVSGSAAIVTLLCFAAVRRRRAPRVVAAVGAGVVLLVGVSRIYLDMHWASDVLGGMLIGTTIGLAFSALFEWTEARARRSSAAQ